MAGDGAIPEKDTPSPKRPRTTATPTGNGEGGSSGPVSMSLVADPDLLDCPICYQSLSSPVYQFSARMCIACASCCTNILKNKCANCCLPIQNIRCRAVEKILESVRITCQNKPYGKKVDHEKACKYLPCSCPCIGCDFVGDIKLLYDHVALKHKDSSKQFHFNSIISFHLYLGQKHVILREGTEGVIFVVNRCAKAHESFLNVVYVAQSCWDKQ